MQLWACMSQEEAQIYLSNEADHLLIDNGFHLP